MRLWMKHALYQDLFPTSADVFRKCIYNHKTKQASKSPKFQSGSSSKCFTIDVVRNITCLLSTVYFLLSYWFFLVSHFTKVV